MEFKKTKEESIPTMSNHHLPEEILEDILLRLPGRSLLRCRCMNKFYYTLIGTPRFRLKHHEISNIDNNTSIVFSNSKAIQRSMYTIDYKSISSLLPLSTSSTTKCDQFMNQMDYPAMFRDGQVEFLSSCNGLVWISRETDSDREFYIWNPSTKVFKNIPMARQVNSSRKFSVGYGFCYDYKNNDYKLIRSIGDPSIQCSHVDVYTLSSNSWNDTHYIPFYLYYLHHEYNNGVVFYGALHWLVNTFEQGSPVLVCFDTSNERFVEVALPETPMPYPGENLEEQAFCIRLGVLEGCLCLAYHVLNVRVDVWMMQEYGVRKSWTKSFSITQESIIRSAYLELIWSFSNGEILWEVDKDFILYEPKKKIYRKLVLEDYDRSGKDRVRSTVAQNYVASSIKL